MIPLISLCIPTMDRYDSFLVNYIPKYLANPYINEIIICDENGNDKYKIDNKFNNLKLKTFKNNNILGPFLNKINCVLKATNEWICLMDSDNFADIDYFETIIDYFKNNSIDKTTILAPSFAKPQFDYRLLEGLCITKDIFKNKDFQDTIKNSNIITCMNTGNYFFNKYIIQNLNLEKETINKSPYDVIYMNILFFEQFNIKFIILSQLYYSHVVHNGSTTILTGDKYKDFLKYIIDRFTNLK